MAAATSPPKTDNSPSNSDSALTPMFSSVLGSAHRLEELPHLGVRPDKRPLDVRQPDVANVDVVQQPRQVVVHTLEAGLQVSHAILSSDSRCGRPQNASANN